MEAFKVNYVSYVFSELHVISHSLYSPQKRRTEVEPRTVCRRDTMCGGISRSSGGIEAEAFRD
jgi:hypothetical protein